MLHKSSNLQKWFLVRGLVIFFPAVLVLFAGADAFEGDIINEIVPPSVVFEALVLNRDLPTLARPKYLSPTDIAASPDGRLLYVAEQTAKRIDVIDVASASVVIRIRLPNEVTGLAVAPDGRRVYATCSSDIWPSGKVCVVDASDGRVVNSIAVGHGARAPVITPDGSRLFVCDRFDNYISVIELNSFRQSGRVAAVREPYCAAITPDGRTLVVGNLLPGGKSTDSIFVSCVISIIDLQTLHVDTVRLKPGSHSVAGISVSADGKYAFATHLIGKFDLIGSTVEKGWVHTNDLAVIDIAERRLINQVCLDLSMAGMANPWSVRCSDDGVFMAITLAGANELSVIDYKSFIDTVLARSKTGIDMQKDFTSMLNNRKRVQIEAACPRALALIGKQAFVAGYYADANPVIEVYNLSLETSRAAYRIPLDKPQPMTAQRKGEALFYDASLCFQKWQSCHSCHTFTRADGFHWMLCGVAMPSPKNTKSLLYSWWTPPTKWTGYDGHAEKSVSLAIELKLFRVSVDELALPLDTFIMNLKPTPSPYLPKGRLSGQALRGRKLFFGDKAGCYCCHPAPLFCDLKSHESNIKDPYDVNNNWNTPSLVESWRSAPYGHIGSLNTIQEMLRASHNGSSLTISEIEDLAAYVNSL